MGCDPRRVNMVGMNVARSPVMLRLVLCGLPAVHHEQFERRVIAQQVFGHEPAQDADFGRNCIRRQPLENGRAALLERLHHQPTSHGLGLPWNAITRAPSGTVPFPNSLSLRTAARTPTL